AFPEVERALQQRVAPCILSDGRHTVALDQVGGLARVIERRHTKQNRERILLASQFLERNGDAETGVVAQIKSQRGLLRGDVAGDLLADLLGFEHSQVAAHQMDAPAFRGEKRLRRYSR